MFSGTDDLTGFEFDQDAFAQFLAQEGALRHSYMNEHGQWGIALGEDGEDLTYFNDFFDAI